MQDGFRKYSVFQLEPRPKCSCLVFRPLGDWTERGTLGIPGFQGGAESEHGSEKKNVIKQILKTSGQL